MIENEKSKSVPSQTVLAMLVRARDPETNEYMSAKQVRDEVMTMFLGGTDTTGNTTSWLFYNLHAHPEIQEKVREEIKSVVGERTPHSEDLMKLSYLRRVIDETLRLFPQNWVMSRDTLEKDTVAGVEIPADTTVFIGVYLIHRREDFWDKPLLFDPDRFLPERSAGRHPLCYLPFGAGQRKCIGFNFALMEMLLATTLILQNYTFSIQNPEKVKPNPTWSLWPSPGLPILFREK